MHWVMLFVSCISGCIGGLGDWRRKVVCMILSLWSRFGMGYEMNSTLSKRRVH
jgi:hypothetical protein